MHFLKKSLFGVGRGLVKITRWLYKLNQSDPKTVF